MYLAIITLPLLGSIAAGFFGRKLGISGAQFIASTSVIVTTILAIFAFLEVGLNNIPVSINLTRWIDSESLNVLWGFQFDSLTVSMLIPVLIVSSLVHVYSIGYMSHDPHNQRFFSYLSLFTFMMIILVTANNYLLMFVGWEGVGVCSYLLVSFWFTRIAANQSSISAFLTNRVGDCFLTIGMFAILWSFGNVDYSTVFSLAPFVNENIVTIIGICLLIGAMAKSSQVGLHVWLPMAMEGPTPVSALIHAATMVKSCRWLMWINQLWYRYILGLPYIKFIHILSFLNKMDKKILCSRVNNTFVLERVNQQETLKANSLGDLKSPGIFCNKSNENKGSSETTCDITYDFNEYHYLIPQHKKKINIKFLEWFIGFTEGDGSFIVSKNKVYFDITQSLQDIQVLYYIKKELGFGKVIARNEIHRNVGVFYVSSKENFTRLMAIFNGNISTIYKKEQFKKWLDTYNKQYTMNTAFKNRLVKPSLNSGWISGFSDAEGCFYGRVKVCRTSKLRKAPHLTFQVSQKEFEILKTIRAIFLNHDGLDLKNINYDKSWNGWTFHCSSFIKLKVIRNYFSRYKLKTKKLLAFQKWCKIHDMVLNKKHLTLEGLNKIDLLSKDINKFIS
jgi:hypothetical protein